jgi:IMP dehydrogenase
MESVLKKIVEIPLGLTFDDVLLVPQHSDINSRSDVDIKSRFSRKIPLKVPLVSSPMDTVTEVEMAIAMGRVGGLGIIHRFMTIEDQVKMIEKVKRAESFFIEDPITISRNTTVKQIKELIDMYNIHTFPVTDKKTFNHSPKRKERHGSINIESSQYEKLEGLITKKDLVFVKDDLQLAEDIMTPREKLCCLSREEVNKSLLNLIPLFHEKKVEKFPIVDEYNQLIGIIAYNDILRLHESGLANHNTNGSIYVGAAVGGKDDYVERSEALVNAGCDVLVVDVANGHSQLCIDSVRALKDRFEVEVVAGSVATSQGALDLIKAGADGIRCGIGNGSICSTRLVAGSGVPQLTALLDIAPICKEYDVPLISDGGNRNSGNMAKALAAGADCIMLGRLVAGCEESPSKVIYRDDKLCKIYRGMAGYGANVSKSQRLGIIEPNTKTFTPEGVEGYIPYAGPLKDVINQFTAGIKSGMSYSGARNIKSFQEKAQFIRITPSGSRESGIHDITKI